MGLVLGSYVAEKPDKRKTRSLLNDMGHEEVNQILFKNNLGQSDRNLSFSTLGSRSMQCPEDFHGYTSLPLLRYRRTAISGCLWILCFRILRWPWSYQWSGLPLPVFLSICPGSALTSVTKSSKRRGQDPKPNFHPRASYSSLPPIRMHPIWALVLSGALACLLSVTILTGK